MGGHPAKFICKTQDYANKCLAETPNYNKENLINNKREEIRRIYEWR